MKKPVIYKVCDAVDCLVIGATYNAVPSGRMVRFTNEQTGTVIHVYPHDVERALSRGALKVANSTTKASWQCELCDKLCHHTESGCSY